MTHWEQTKEYERLRAGYQLAFARLRAEEPRLRSIAEQGRIDATAEAALTAYRQSRERLARFLISSRPPGGSTEALFYSAGRPS
jgi:hypothetical protein